MSDALGLYNYWIAIFLMMVGFYNVIASSNLVKKLIGLSIFQTSVFLLYITMGKVKTARRRFWETDTTLFPILSPTCLF